MTLPRTPQRTTPGFAFSMVDRALTDCLGHRQFGKEEQDEVVAFFGQYPPECVFCGNREVKRWDHLVPVMKGGETVLGNMVPACARCDDSKRDLPFEEWMLSDTRYSPRSRGIKNLGRRVRRIKAYIEHYGYTARSLEQRLDECESARLATIRSRLQRLRDDVNKLIEQYRERTGNT